MSDIDFDELDKAVSSLMYSPGAPADSKKSADATQSTPKATRPFPTSRRSMMTKNISTPPAKASVITLSSEAVQTPKPTVPVPRRNGRFMDVVDSSAELNPIRQPITAPVREQSKTVQQQVATSVEDSTATRDTLSSIPPLASVVVPARTSSVTDTTGDPVQVRRVEKNSNMPDPLELVQDDSFAATDDTRPAAVFGVSAMESVPVSASPQVVPQIPDPIDMLNIPNEQIDVTAPEDTNENIGIVQESESPFLTDAKIEKRPLNANPVATSNVEPFVVADKLLVQDLPAQETQANDFTAELVNEPPVAIADVPELSNELVALEATGRLNAEEDEALAPIAMGSSTDSSNQNNDPSTAVGPASIAQQYKSTQSTGDTSHAPIYDASQYTDPVTHPVNKKSGWLWVLSVLILLALGSGGAVALYLTGIIP